MNHNEIQRDSNAWLFFVKVSFVIAVSSAFVGIYFLPVEMWIQGYCTMALLYTLGSSFTLAKTLRDEHEASKLINKLSSVKTEKILKGLDVAA